MEPDPSRGSDAPPPRRPDALSPLPGVPPFDATGSHASGRPDHERLSDLATLSAQTLLRAPLTDVFARALDIVRDDLGIPLVAYLEPVRGAETLIMRAGTGWRPGAVGQMLLPSKSTARLAFALQHGQAVLTTHNSEALGFHRLPLFREHGVTSGLSVVVSDADGVRGVLGAYSREPHEFGPGDVQFLQVVGNVLAGALERESTQEGLLQSQERLQSMMKMEAIGRLAGRIAHDFNNLMQAVGLCAEDLLTRLPVQHPAVPTVEEITRVRDRAAALTRQLLAFSRQQVLKPQVVDLNAVVRQVEQLLRRLIGEDVELETILADDLGAIRADAVQLEQVLMNLAVNSRDAMPEGGTLTIETRNVELRAEDQREAFRMETGPYVLLAVSDTGSGMTAETKARAFYPFFTTKPEGKGTGLGLSTVYGIVKQSGGYILVDSAPHEGTGVRIYLPRVEGPVASVEPKRSAPPVKAARRAPRGAGVILLVEDEKLVRELMRDYLGAHGYTVLDAGNGVEGVARADAHAGPIDLLVADVVMPQMGGRALAERLQPRRPEMRVLYVSGYADDAYGDPDPLGGGSEFLQKPFAMEALLRKVREMLEGPAPETGAQPGE